MSDARKCDRCETFFSPEPGAVGLDVHIDTDAEGSCTSWSDIDLCKPCGRLLLALIAACLNDLDPKLLQ